ncbi:MAG TPA: flippase-like domain-containing protein [Candidatus Saccharimonadales bacterium]|nr:flippase-like domain-containing protein [Candidatus Saccharimonadales bacterium]
MSRFGWMRRRWKLILNIVTLAALLILIFAIRNQISDTIGNLAKVNAAALFLMIPVEALNYHSQTRLYQRLFLLVGNKLDYAYLFKASLELNFVNHVFPSGGVTGLSYFSLRLREGQKLTGAKATLVHFMKLALIFLSFEVLIIFGLLSLAALGRVNNLIILVAGSLSTILLIGTVGFFYMVEKRSRINQFFTILSKALNRLIQIIMPKYPETINISQAKVVVDDFHANYIQIRQSYRRLKVPFLYALLANITEVMALYVVFIAFGHFVNIGAVILAYAIANFAGLISVLPGGVGIYEVLMTTVLAATGVPAAVSLPVIVMYRLLNTLIQIPPGYFLYQRTLHNGSRLPGTEGSITP